MEELTEREMSILLHIIKDRLNYESRRKRRFNSEGKDVQFGRVMELNMIRDKLEDMRLTL